MLPPPAEYFCLFSLRSDLLAHALRGLSLKFRKLSFISVIRAILTRPFLADVGLLLLRVFTGVLLIHHGYEKLANIGNFADAFVRPLGLPFPITLSYIAAFSEVGGSWLLITGLLTRFGALAILGTMSVAIYHAVSTAGFNIYLLELLGLYFASATAILAVGPGRFSVDELIARRFAPDTRSQADRLEAAFTADSESTNDIKADVVADGVS